MGYLFPTHAISPQLRQLCVGSNSKDDKDMEKHDVTNSKKKKKKKKEELMGCI